jgi:hypothetical protein
MSFLIVTGSFIRPSASRRRYDRVKPAPPARAGGTGAQCGEGAAEGS